MCEEIYEYRGMLDASYELDDEYALDRHEHYALVGHDDYASVRHEDVVELERHYFEYIQNKKRLKPPSLEVSSFH